MGTFFVRRISLGLLPALWLAVALPVFAETPRDGKGYACGLLREIPELDGEVMEDPAWEGCTEALGFTNLQTGLPSEKQTVFRLGFTPEALFVAVVCAEPNSDAIHADLGDGHPFWGEDSISLYVCPDVKTYAAPGRKPDLVFSLNAIGSRWSPRTLKRWEAVTYIDDGKWSAEVRLPWEVIGSFPPEGAPWRFNILRSIPGEGETEYSTWSNLEHRFYEARHFGTLAFEGIDAAMRQAAEQRLRDNIVRKEHLVYTRPEVGVLLQSDFRERRLVYKQGAHVCPRLAPDAGRILFNSVEGGEPGVWIVPRDDGKAERICSGSQGAWSPDGARIVLQRSGRIVEHDLSSGQERVVSPEGAAPLSFPIYLTGGSGAARFACVDEAGGRIVLLDPEAGAPVETLVECEIHSAPACAPDGKTLAYQDGAHIFLMDLVSRAARQLTVEPGVQAWPVWSLDGQSLRYVRASLPTDESWQIAQVEIENPCMVRLVEAPAHPGFDWLGASAMAGRKAEYPESSLTIWRGSRASDPEKAPAEGDGWRQVDDADTGADLGPRVAVENAFLVLHLAPEGIFVVPKGENDGKPIRVRALALDENADVAVARVLVHECTPDAVSLAVAFGDAQQPVAGAAISLMRTRPVVRIVPPAMQCRVSFDADLQCAVVPDRLANDVLVDAARVPAGGSALLPRSPIVLGCLAEAQSLVMLVAEESDICVEVASEMDQTSLTGLTVRTEGEPFALAVLSEGPPWSRLEPASKGKGWTAAWRRPFFAEWRAAVRAEDEARSRMWNTKDLGELGGAALPLADGLDATPQAAVIYAWARDAITPPNVLTPSDIVLDVLGVDGYLAALDTEGVLGYRSGDGQPMLRELVTHGRDWHPAMASDDVGEFGIIETMGSVFPVDSPGVRSLMTHLGNDAISLVRGLDSRIAEYESSLDELMAFCDGHGEADPSGFLAALRGEAETLAASLRAEERMDLARAETSLEKVLAMVGTMDAVTLDLFETFCHMPGNDDWAQIHEDFMSYLAAKEGRIWYDKTVRFELWYDDSFKAFARNCQRALKERQALASHYRSWLQRARDSIAGMIVANPEFKPSGDALRAHIGTALRNRYYLERDWRGETPLPNGALQ